MVTMTRSKGGRSRQAKLDTFLSPTRSTGTASPSKHTQAKASPTQYNSSPIKRYFQSKKPGEKRTRAVAIVSDDDSEVSDDEQGGASVDPSDVDEIRFEPRPPPKSRQAVESSDDDEEVKAISSPSEIEEDPGPSLKTPRNVFGTQARKTVTKRTRLPSTPPSSHPPSPPSEAELSSPIAQRADRGKKRLVIESDEEDGDEESPPKKKRKVSLKHFDQEAEDMREMREEIEPELIIESKLRGKRNTKMSAFQKNLERLKRKRAGPVVDDYTDEEEEEEEVEEAPKPFRGARPGVIELDSDDEVPDPPDGEEQDDEDAFIIEDDDEAVAVDLPAEYNMHSYQDASHHFKVVCQLFVHLIMTGDNRRVRQRLMDTEYFKIALNALRRSIGSTRESLVASSVWRPEFRKVLETKPKLWQERMITSWPGCDACHLGARISTIEAHVKGKKWGGLLDPNQPTDSDEDSDEDEDEEGGEIMYRVGRICANRLRVYHEFSHWEHVLYDGLQDQIRLVRPQDDDDNAHRPERMFVHADAPEDVDDPDAIMDWLDRKAVIAIEWNRFKQMLESAQNLEKMKPEDDMLGG
ncbi:hypothetical protein CALCODRAFT_520703 [Calocera cornea HHB12733]|uniref:DUF4211 domain-containing protein n=1 Tax=Calocera cornea HHB12733 TaxID=1353952 RepID=A0A165DBH1_9BASI|nr:hypothetical protein CALCODRAFT_520703 [Calocera cornea HHB12733]